MNDWLDDLSEDWPSQPPSAAGTTNSRPVGSSASRIPRAIGKKTHGQPSRLNGTGSLKNGVLKERSFSSENIIAGTPRLHSGKKPAQDTLRSSSEGSSPRIHSTVERKSATPSPTKQRALDETPEWRRRLLMGEMDYGQKKDLFAPTGIQSIFQRPPEQSSEEQKPRNLSFLKHLDAMPSSPPWPLSSMISACENQLDSIAELETVDEVEEKSRQTSRNLASPFEHEQDADSPQDSSLGSLPPSKPVSRIISRALRAASGESHDESFSAVFISKHNTANGSVRYEPVQRQDLPAHIEQLKQSNTSLRNSNASSRLAGSVAGTESGSQSMAGTRLEDIPDAAEESSMLPEFDPEFVTVTRGGLADTGSWMRRPLSPSPTRPQSALQHRPRPILEAGNSSEVINSNISSDPLVHGSFDAVTPKQKRPGQETKRVTSQCSEFGIGELDEYEFSGVDTSDATLPSNSPASDVAPPGAQQPFRFKVASESPKANDESSGDTSLPFPSTPISLPKRNSIKKKRASPELNEKGKRSNPIKLDSTPKRLRTNPLHEIEFEAANQRLLETLQGTSTAAELIKITQKSTTKQTFIGDAYHTDATFHQSVRATPNVLAQRKILRPRNPTPSQRRYVIPTVRIEEASDGPFSSSPAILSASDEASFARPSMQSMMSGTSATSTQEDVRKRSVTTEDYLDHATKVMDFLRAHHRPSPGLGNLEESHLEQDETDPDVEYDTAEFPTNLSISRPPSRENGTGWRERQLPSNDPDVNHRLQMFREEEEDDFFSASLASRFGSKLRKTGAVEAVESDPPGLTIIPQSLLIEGDIGLQAPSDEAQTKSIYSRGSTPDRQPDDSGDEFEREDETAGTDSIPSSRTHHTIQTNTSDTRRSDNLGTLAPDVVKHLIPELVAGMSFDQDKGLWVKSPRKESTTTSSEGIPVPSSDADPFGDIADLTVDKSMEEVRLRKARELAYIADERLAKHMEFDSIRSGDLLSRRTSGQADAHISKQDFVQPTSDPLRMDVRESSRDIGSETDPTTPPKRVVSRPLPPIPVSNVAGIEEPSVASHTSHDDKTTTPRESPSQASPSLPSSDEPTNSTPIQKAPDSRHVNFAISVTQPPSTPVNHQVVQPQSVDVSLFKSSFMLSELSDFTFHQEDERLAETRVVGRSKPKFEDRYAWGNHQLVKAMYDVLQEGLHWEFISEMKLQNKGLTSLHILDKLCPRLEIGDFRGNELCQLTGAPSSLRGLNVAQNKLSKITFWGSFLNLQRLDVSGNAELSDLGGLRGLIHLRDLNVSGCNVQDLDPLLGLDGLIKLEARNNRLITVDLQDSKLRSLQVLNLGANTGLNNISSLQKLSSLSTLSIDQCAFLHFPHAETLACPSIQSVDLASNALKTFTLAGRFSALHTIILDHNSLLPWTVDLSGSPHISLLSLRHQRSQPPKPSLYPEEISDISNLRLSSTALHQIGRTLPGISNVTRLELCNVGIKKLPINIGKRFPSVRFLNLNENSLQEIDPLAGMGTLEAVLLARNRIGTLRRVAAVLGRIESLRAVDLRENPISSGFHPWAKWNAANAAEACEIDAHGQNERRELSVYEVDGAARVYSAYLRLAEYALSWSRDRAEDERHISGMDEDTRIRRRVFDICFVTKCKSLQWMNGVPISEDEMKRMGFDGYFSRLKELRVLEPDAEGEAVKMLTGEEGIDWDGDRQMQEKIAVR